MAQRQLEERMSESERSVEDLKEKIPELEKTVAELNKSMEKLFNNLEEQRLAMVDNQKALANLATGMSRSGAIGEKEVGQKRKAPENESATSSRKEPRR